MLCSLQIDASTSQSEIDEIIDDPRYLSIVNSSGWPTNRCITMQSRSAFLHGLIVGEFSKRVNLMKYFARGLDTLKVFNAVKRNPVLMRHLFVYNEDGVLTLEKFVQCLRTKRPTDEEKGKVYDWFLEYVHRKGAAGVLMLCDILTVKYLMKAKYLHCTNQFMYYTMHTKSLFNMFIDYAVNLQSVSH